MLTSDDCFDQILVKMYHKELESNKADFSDKNKDSW